jgi:hypothetical protein
MRFDICYIVVTFRLAQWEKPFHGIKILNISKKQEKEFSNRVKYLCPSSQLE